VETIKSRPGLRMAVWLGAGWNCAAYRFYARSVCDMNLQRCCSTGMRLVALYKCYMPLTLPASFLQSSPDSPFSRYISHLL